MKMKTGMLMAVVAAAVMACSVSCAWAGEGWGGAKHGEEKGEHFDTMAKELNLTPQQKDALAKERQASMPKMKELREKLRAAREQLKAELDKVTPDKAKLDALVTDLKNLAGEKVQMMIDRTMAMKRILTPEQSARMKAIMEQKKGEFKKKRGGDRGDKEMSPPHEDL